MDIYSLVKKKCSKQSFKDEAFNSILKKCFRRIKYNIDHNETYTFYTVPSYEFGFPPFDRYECTNFLQKSLEQNNLKVKKYKEFILLISWEDIFNKCNEDVKNEENLVNCEPLQIKKPREMNVIEKSNQLLFNHAKFSLLN
jgi:hypothetical protein